MRLPSAFRAVLFSAAALSAALTLPAPGVAQTAQPTPAAASTDDVAAPLTIEELKILAARIALYPDDLVALCMAASLYPLQIVEAQRFLEEKKAKPDMQPSDKWDGSIISLLNYPDIVKSMNDDLDWVQQLGAVTANQQKDLLVAIQQLRDEAVAKGILKSTPEVQVVHDSGSVIIKSSDPKTTYVPRYEPEILYQPDYVVSGNPVVYESYPSYYYPTAPYWAGVVTGAAFAAAVDWDDWHAWGGDVDVDVDIGDRVDFDFNKIDIDKIDRDKLKNFDFKNIDRSKLNLTNANFDHNKLLQNLKSRSGNNLGAVAKSRANLTAARQGQGRALAGKDVRKNVVAGLKNKPGNQLPRPGTRVGSGGKVVQNLKTQRPAVRRDATQRVTNKKVNRNQFAGVADRRPRTPSAFGDVRPGRVAMNHSNRGNFSRGGGQQFRGGANMGGRQFGGGGRQFRGGGGRRR